MSRISNVLVNSIDTAMGTVMAAAILTLALDGPAVAQTAAAQPASPLSPPAPMQSAAATPALPAGKNSVENRDNLGQLPSAADLRPTGPVTVTARHAELVQGNSAVYTGNVVMDSDTLKLDGDRLELHQDADGQYLAKITGTPGHLAHAGAGPDNPPVSAHAKTLNYDSRTGIVDLIGDALFRRGSDEITGDVIHYNVVERHIDASGGDSGQVRIVIQAPPPPSAPAKPGTPVAPATAPTTSSRSSGDQNPATGLKTSPSIQSNPNAAGGAAPLPAAPAAGTHP